MRVNQTPMVDQLAEQVAKVRRRARPWRSIFALLLAALAVAGSAVARQQSRDLDDKLPLELIAAGCAVAFFVFGFGATLGLSGRARDLLLPRVGNAHATMVRLLIVLVGGLAVLILTLQLLNLPVGQLVLGGALTGVLVGIAAQQTLANLFAGIILLLSKPFVVGDDVRLWSGPLGGEFEGTVLEIGLTYVRLEAAAGEFRLPNAQVLSSAVGPRAVDGPVVATATATGVTATAHAEPVPGGPDGRVEGEPSQAGANQAAGPVQTGPVAAQGTSHDGGHPPHQSADEPGGAR
jgi:small-conductance mechanosensitive channel